MDIDRERLREALRQKYAPNVVFYSGTNGLRPGDEVEFDIEERKEGGHLKRYSKKGVVIERFTHGPDQAERVYIVVPAVVESNGKVAIPARPFTRSRDTVHVIRHGGPVHESQP